MGAGKTQGPAAVKPPAPTASYNHSAVSSSHRFLGYSGHSSRGGTIELPGFAVVTFPEGAFDSPHEVTVEATSQPEPKALFRISVGLPTVDHELRILTGSRRPSEQIQVAMKVPEVFLDQVPSSRVPVLFAIGRYSSPSETVDDYFRLESEFDEATKLLTANVEQRDFQEYEPGRGLQALLRISTKKRE